MSSTKFILLGGFLGAGKTTLITEIAKRYVADGQRVAIITNDQADDLVDTETFRSEGFDVGEVAGACFCCSFEELIQTTDSLSSDRSPDVVLAEPVGSCTDLVATVIRPLQNLHEDQFDLAPFGVIVKPSHGLRILASDQDAARRGFSKEAEYIFFKQLEEADFLIIGRADQISPEQIDSLRTRLKQLAPDVPIVVASPKSGTGVAEVMGYLESPMLAGRRVLDIDYDTYADGEADLGWVNMMATVSREPSGPIDVHLLVQTMLEEIEKRLDPLDASIAHLKVSAQCPGDPSSHAIASIIANGQAIDWARVPTSTAGDDVECVINARVAFDPEQLEVVCRDSANTAAKGQQGFVTVHHSRHLRPGRPTPTHRYADASS